MSLPGPELERFVAHLAASPGRWRHLVRHAYRIGSQGELQREVLTVEEELRAKTLVT